MELKKDILEILQKTVYPEQSLEDLSEMDWSPNTKDNEIFFLSHNLVLKAKLEKDILTLNDFNFSYFYKDKIFDLVKNILDYSFTNEINKIEVNESSTEIEEICKALNLRKEENTFIMCFSE